MDPSRLTERVRGILGTPGPSPAASRAVPGRRAGGVDAALGGVWQGPSHETYLLVERHHDRLDGHGTESVGTMADDLRAAGGTPLDGRTAVQEPFVFFDLETTGLSGGAGTLAFLVGCGWFDEAGGFVTRQYLLADPSCERALLQDVAAAMARSGAIVSFNGKAFDAPVLETRYLFHRLPWALEGRPHLDVLHPARRFWRDDAGCSLGALERQVLGAPRLSDVPGFEIPERYFRFLRDGDARPLAAVLEHNRLDLLSLAGLTARLARLARVGPSAARDAREALALGHLLSRAGADARALEAFERASAGDAPATVQAAAHRALALAARRRRRHEEAALHWRRLLEIDGCPETLAREATSALAVHHEHRAHNLATARAFALRSLDHGQRPAWRRAVQHRLARLDRKLEREAGATLLD